MRGHGTPYALADFARRDAVRGGSKSVWGLVIAVGNLPGAIGYLVAGRTAPEVDAPGAGSAASAASDDSVRRAVDALFGPRDQR